MAQQHSHPGFSKTLPSRIPLFPLREALLLPGGDLPLNIFEQRYLAMTQWAMSTDRMIGMIQPKANSNDLYQIGCAGRITNYQETDDGRYLITLRGISRFHLIDKPQLTSDNFLLGAVDWSDFPEDCEPPKDPPEHLCRKGLRGLLETFLARENLTVDWDQAACIPEAKFYTLLAMVAPFTASEKQALLEARDISSRCALLVQMLEIATADPNRGNRTPNSLLH